MADTNILQLKTDINNEINQIFHHGAFNKNDDELMLNKIYNYLKTQKIGSGRDELLKKQKKQILHYKNKLNHIINIKIFNMQQTLTEDNKNKFIDELSLLQNKQDELKINIKIEIENINSDKLKYLRLILVLHLVSSSLNITQGSSSSEEDKKIKSIVNNLKDFNDFYISDDILPIFLNNSDTKQIFEMVKQQDTLSKLDTTHTLLHIHIYSDNNNILIYKIENIFYKIEIINGKNECNMYILNKDDDNIKQYLENISKDKKIDIYYI